MSLDVGATPEDVARLAILKVKMRPREAAFQPLPHQVPPDDPDWDTWVLLAGRGAGKTRAGTEYVMEHMRKFGRRARVGVMAPTNKSAREICAEGESGVISLYQHSDFRQYNRTMLEAWHKNGGYIKFAGAEMVDYWRGPQWSLLWIDEWCICDPEAIDNALFGLRLGIDPKTIATTTPRPLTRLRELLAQPGTRTSKASSYENPHIAKKAVARLEARYGGTRLGRQELDAEILDDVEGALWSHEMIDANRVSPEDILPEDMTRMVVAIDPAVTANKRSDQTAICVAGSLGSRHNYVFHLEGKRQSPASWGKEALKLYLKYQADKIIGERNNGGDLVRENIMNAYKKAKEEGWWEGPPPRIDLVWASRGKTTRAEPIAALDEQGMIHHVGVFGAAEDQMAVYPVEAEHEGDDMVDARVWAIADLSGAIQPVDVMAPVLLGQSNVWRG